MSEVTPTQNTTHEEDTTPPLNRSFLIGEWQVEPDLNQLIRLAQPATRRSLEPRLMHLLCFMAANPDRVLSRETLTVELWPKVIVNENSLTRAVSALRRQLDGADNGGKDYLETIPKKGYRLRKPVRLLKDEIRQPDTLSPVSATSPATGPVSVLANWLGASAFSRRPLITAFLLMAALPVIFQPPRQFSGEPIQVAQSEAYSDQLIDQSTGLDGARLTLSALGIDRDQTLTGGASGSMAVSGDGSMLAILRHEGDMSRLYIVWADTDAKPVAVFSSEDYLYNLEWSPVGNALLFARESSTVLPALLGSAKRRADLIMLDIDTLTVTVLIDNTPAPRDPAAAV